MPWSWRSYDNAYLDGLQVWFLCVREKNMGAEGLLCGKTLVWAMLLWEASMTASDVFLQQWRRDAFVS